MNKLQNISLSYTRPDFGVEYKVDLNLSILIPKLKEKLGADMASLALHFFINLIKSRIERMNLEKEITDFAKEDKLELKNLQAQEKNLNA